MQPYNINGDGDDEIIVGHIVAPWGVRGELKINPLTDVPNRFENGSSLRLRGHPVTVMESKRSGSHLVVKLAEVPDRNTAEGLRGEYLAVSSDEVPVLTRENTYYHFQIIGIQVRNENGDHLGEVNDILNTGSNDVYVVRDDVGHDLLVPAIGDVVLEVDTDHNNMTVRLLEGLDERSN